MRVLVIGGTGFIGPHVVGRLVAMGHDVTVFHRGRHEADLPASVRHIHAEEAGMPVTAFPQELKRPAPEVVLHMVPVGEQDTREAVRAFRGVARRLIAISSGDVYRAYGVLLGLEPGPPDPVPLPEGAPLRRVLYPYRGLSSGPEDWRYHYEKILAERAVLSDPELEGTVLRLPAVYGPGDPARRLLPYVKRMLDGRPAILLGERQARWRWSHGYVENVAAAIALAATHEAAAGRVYNVGEDEVPTLAERIRRLGQVAAWEGRLVILPEGRLPAHLREGSYRYEQDLVTETARLRTDLQHEDPVPLEEALRRTIEWERANPPVEPDPARFDYQAEDAALADAFT